MIFAKSIYWHHFYCGWCKNWDNLKKRQIYLFVFIEFYGAEQKERMRTGMCVSVCITCIWTCHRGHLYTEPEWTAPPHPAAAPPCRSPLQPQREAARWRWRWGQWQCLDSSPLTDPGRSTAHCPGTLQTCGVTSSWKSGHTTSTFIYLVIALFSFWLEIRWPAIIAFLKKLDITPGGPLLISWFLPHDC